MRRIGAATAATLALVAVGWLDADRAAAAALSTPVAIRAAADGTGLAQSVSYTCRKAWRCGPYDCGWRRVCAWAGWRPDWRNRPYWRRHQWRRHYW